MKTPIGEMRTPVAVLTPTTVQDASGGASTTYIEGDPIFVALRAMTAKEQEQFGQMSAEVSYTCFGHYYDLDPLTSSHRIRDLETDDEFDIVGPPMSSRNRDHSRLNLVRREND